MAFENKERTKDNWDKNVKLMIGLMAIWFLVLSQIRGTISALLNFIVAFAVSRYGKW